MQYTNVKSNPMVVLREEFDDWAILFDPDSGEGYALNPVSVLIWKCLDGNHTRKDILVKLNARCENVSDDVGSHYDKFVQDLIENGLAGYATQT